MIAYQQDWARGGLEKNLSFGGKQKVCNAVLFIHHHRATEEATKEHIVQNKDFVTKPVIF